MGGHGYEFQWELQRDKTKRKERGVSWKNKQMSQMGEKTAQIVDCQKLRKHQHLDHTVEFR